MLPAKLQQTLNEGMTLQRQGRVADAAVRYARVRAAAPYDFEAWHLGGMAALLLGRVAEARALLERAVKMKPRAATTAFGLGVAHIAAGDLPAAEVVLRSAVELDPSQGEAWHHLAFALKTGGKFSEAIEAHRRAVALRPNFAEAWHAFGATLAHTGSRTEALACFERALAIAPAHAQARLGRTMMLYQCHRVAEAEPELAAAVAREPKNLEARSYHLMALNCLDGRSREEIFAAHTAYGEAAGAPAGRRWPNDPYAARRLRVAFLSPDLREHSVAYFLEPLLRHLDREAFEVVLYHDHAIVDATSGRLRGLAAGWRHFAGQTDGVVEEAVRADAPDILVDLAGHTGQNRLPLLARRLAPVQVTYLGYPNTTGLGAMDYRLVDEVTDPTPEANRFATEKLLRFAPTAWAYEPPAEAPEPVALPPSATTGRVTFGSFNNFAKATDATLRLWARLLDAVPGSRLVVKAGGLAEPAVREPLVARLRAAGLGDDRAELLGHTRTVAEHLAHYGQVDVALDMAPYNGTTTTCEALWMGVPVVTLAGDRHAARVGASLLHAAGHPEWIATTPEDYVRIAVELAGDVARRTSLRNILRGDLRRGPLLDHAGQAERFGKALRYAWTVWCARTAAAAA